MKRNKVLALWLIVVMVFALTACDNKVKLEAPKPDESKKPDMIATDPPDDPGEVTDDKTIVIGKPIKFDGFEMVVTELRIVDTWDETKALRITYDWKNTSEKEMTPAFCFLFKSFQNKVEVEGITISDDIDLGPGQKMVKPGGEIKGAHDGVPIEDMNQPLLIELSELFSLDDVVYSLEIADLNEYN